MEFLGTHLWSHYSPNMDQPVTNYLDREGSTLAYQVLGSGSVDLVCYLEVAMHIDLLWTDPHYHQLMEHTGSYARTAYLQPRGFGLSEPIDHVVSVEEQAEDILAVMDAVGMRRAVLVGAFSNSAGPALVAARHPERVSGLLLLDPFAQGAASSDRVEDLHGWTQEQVDAFLDAWTQGFADWGDGSMVRAWDPVLDNPFNRRLLGMLQRCSATPSVAHATFEAALRLDVRDVLRSVQVPTTVLRSPNGSLPEPVVAYVAELIPDATLVTLPPTEPGMSLGESLAAAFGHVEEVATGAAPETDADRFLGTVLFTDVVGSTELLAEKGDAAYRGIRDAHERQVRHEVERRGGRLIKVVGDGTMSVFEGPTKAVRAAEAICSEAASLGLAVRAGVHSGEVERAGFDVHGMSVHIGARVADAAGGGEVLVSRTVRDLVVGSGLDFELRGEHSLKGVPGTWELYALSGAGGRAAIPAATAGPTPTAMDRMALTSARRAPRAARAAVRLGNAWQRRRVASH